MARFGDLIISDILVRQINQLAVGDRRREEEIQAEKIFCLAAYFTIIHLNR
jgi:hypothetical protein